MLAGIGEDELETAGIVGSAGLEGIFGRLQQIDIGTGHIVDEVDVFHFHIFDFHVQRVGTVLGGTETDWGVAVSTVAYYGIFFFTFGDVEFGVLWMKHAFGKHGATIKTNHDAIDDIAMFATDIHDHL